MLAVMIRHFVQEMSLDTAADRMVFALGRLGSNGVDMFFVLSGFLITRILIRARGSEAYFRSFYLRRTVRIFPLYYLALVIAFFIWPAVAPGWWLVTNSSGDHQAWYWLYGCNWLFALKNDYVGLAHFWSLAIEEQFYLLWPLGVLALGAKRIVPFAVAVIGLSVAARWIATTMGASVLALYVATPTRLDGLMLGALVAAWESKDPALDRARKLAGPAAGAALVVLAALLSSGWGAGRTAALMVVGTLAVNVLFAALLVAALTGAARGWPARLFSFRPFVFLGAYSYGIYVVHPFVQDVLARHWQDAWLPRVAGSLLPGRLVFMLLCGTVSVLVALASWHGWEKHWLKLKRYAPMGASRGAKAEREPACAPST
ncbi:MAG: acyltransferase [Acidobacteria bacterium]|nr:MAG: acyltransferase [Acidobacteriota bacterium]MCE7956335.1 acyltransferase [Acidobacteria bacterium ACB2]